MKKEQALALKASKAEKEMERLRRMNNYKERISEARRERFRNSGTGKVLGGLHSGLSKIGSGAEIIIGETARAQRTGGTRKGKKGRKSIGSGYNDTIFGKSFW